MDPLTVIGAFLLLALVAILILWRLVVLIPGPRSKFDPSPDHPTHLMVLLGSGGHTGEMMRLLKDLNIDRYPVRTWVHYPEDAISARKAVEFDAAAISGSSAKAGQLVSVKRARAVGQGWMSSIWTTIGSLISCFRIALLKPDVLVCNGPGTSVTLCGAVFVLKFFGLSKTRIVFIESLARVHSLSLSGKLLLPIADRFLVQWPSVASKYRRAEYYGILV
uniref:UDP-N-acetylglucosamine transferase subunit ALG14 n=1 Tax=Blastobotrys adeninivorans TaxID=409370 RepID=A0A060T4E6_BLAAD